MKKLLNKNGFAIIMLLSAVVLASILLDACVLKISSFSSSIDGIDAAFGLAENGVFSILLTLGYLLPIVVMALCKVLFKKGNLQYLLLVIAFVASAILLFKAPELAKVESFGVSVTLAKAGYELAIGPIIGAVASIFGALVSAYKLCVK